jgi:integrase
LEQKLFQKQDKTINLFEQSIKSEYTRRVYTTCLKIYLEFPGSRKLIHSTDTRKIEDHITDFITSMKKQGKSFGAIQNYISPIIKYYRTKRVSLDTKHIHGYLPEFRKSKKDRAYTYDEIHRLLDIADERVRVIILLLASTGMRVGAIPELRLRNIEVIESEYGKIYKITIYEGFNEEYISFTTPECTTAIDNYLSMRSRYGEKFSPNSFLIREQFDIRDQFNVLKCKQVKANTISRQLIDLAERSGIRKKEGEVLKENKKRAEIRKDVPIAHGFRKFFSTQLVRTKPDIKPELRWLLEGHRLRANDPAYVKLEEKDLLQEYEKGIDNLTINEELRLLKKVEKLQIDKSQLELIIKDVAMLKRKMKR